MHIGLENPQKNNKIDKNRDSLVNKSDLNRGNRTYGDIRLQM